VSASAISIGSFEVRCEGCVETALDDLRLIKGVGPLTLTAELTVSSEAPTRLIQVQILAINRDSGLSEELFDAVVEDGSFYTLNASLSLEEEGAFELEARITWQQADDSSAFDQRRLPSVVVVTTPDLMLRSVTTDARDEPPGLGHDIEITYALSEDELGNPMPLQVQFFLITAELRAIIKTALANNDQDLMRRLWQDNVPEAVTLTLAQVPPGALLPLEESGGVPFRGRISARIPEDLDLTRASTRYILGVADPTTMDAPQGVLPEVDDVQNNIFVMDEPIQILTTFNHPDVVVRSLLAAPTTTPTLEEIQLSFSVINQGGVATTALTPYRVYVSPDEFLDPMTDTLLGHDTIKALRPGERIDVSRLSYTLPEFITEPTQRYVLIWLDPERIGAEGQAERENNVALSNVIEVTGPTERRHDIVVSNLTLDANVAGAYNTPWSVGFSVRNAGNSDLGAFGCRIYFSSDTTLDTTEDTLLAQVPVDGLLPGRIETISWTLLLTPADIAAGSGQLFVNCDPNNLIPESDETNNVAGPSASMTWRFLEPDYQLSGLSAMPLALDFADPNGGDLTLGVDVCNLGSDPGLAPEVEFFLAFPAPSLRADLSIGRGSLGSTFLIDGQCSPLTVTLPARCESILPSYNVIAVVDPDNVVAERNEANNAITARDGMSQPLVVTTQGGSCECPEDSREPNNSIASASDLDAILASDPSDPMARVGMLASALCSQPGGLPENDLYRVGLAPGQTLRVDLLFTPSEGELDIRMFNATNPTNNPALPMVLPDATNAKRGERATFVNTTANMLSIIIAVSADAAGESNTYELELRRFC